MNHIGFTRNKLSKFFVCTIATVVVIVFLLQQGQTIYGKAVLMKKGPAMFWYYRYNGSYYKLGNADADIQKNISLHLYDSFYQIRDIDVSKSIAMFDGRYYHRLNYAFSDTIEFEGKSYLLAVNCLGTPGKLLGSTGRFDVYELKDQSLSEGICVNIGGDWYSPAYPYPSSLSFMGRSYEMGLDKYKVGDRNESYLGKVDSYEIYQQKDTDSSKEILVHLNDQEEVQADFKDASSLKNSIPASIYGTPIEAMYPIFTPVQWKMHGFYNISGNEYDSDMLKKKLGPKVGTYKLAGYSYGLYQVKGDYSYKSLIVKNNQVYLLYKYWFRDTVIFNGHTYVLGDANSNYKTIKQIGSFEDFDIFSIKGMDSSKTVDVWVTVNVPGIGGLHADFIANRAGK